MMALQYGTWMSPIRITREQLGPVARVHMKGLFFGQKFVVHQETRTCVRVDNAVNSENATTRGLPFTMNCLSWCDMKKVLGPEHPLVRDLPSDMDVVNEKVWYQHRKEYLQKSTASEIVDNARHANECSMREMLYRPGSAWTA